MVKTGYISFMIENGGGQDSNYNPFPAIKNPSVYFPCNLATVKKEYKTLIDGQYQLASYKVYIDSDKVTSITLNTIKEVLLQDNDSNVLGTFRIQNIEYLILTKRVKIIV